MYTKPIIHQATINEWVSRIKEQKANGLSVSEWCRHSNLSKDKYIYLKHQIKNEVVEQSLPDIVLMAIPSSAYRLASYSTALSVGLKIVQIVQGLPWNDMKIDFKYLSS